MTIDKLRTIIADLDAAYHSTKGTLDGMIDRQAHPVQISRQRERVSRYAQALGAMKAELIITATDHLLY